MFNGEKNIYGIATKFSASLLPPLHFAKLNAINNWMLSEGLEKIAVNQRLDELDSFQINGRTLYFIDHYENSNRVYSLVSEKDITRDIGSMCPIQQCQIIKCEPSWLCDGESREMQVIGISAQTTHPNEQIRHIIRNAQDLVRISARAQLQGQVYLRNIDTNHITQSSIQQSFRITELESAYSNVKIANLCHYNGNLLAQTLFNFEPVIDKKDWMTAPNYGSHFGVVGHAKGQTSTGRTSDLVEVAMRRGLFELAKAKNIYIENEVDLRLNDNGAYALVRISQQTTESVISAFIADMKMELDDKLQPEIFIWLLENKG